MRPSSTISDSAGTVVRKVEVEHTSGQHVYTWDGRSDLGRQLTDGTYTGGSSDYAGGALWGTNVSITRTTFTSLWAPLGGAIYAETVTAQGGSFIDNSAGSSGGAIFGSTRVTVVGTGFAWNRASGNGGGRANPVRSKAK